MYAGVKPTQRNNPLFGRNMNVMPPPQKPYLDDHTYKGFERWMTTIAADTARESAV
jgi:hypothetical protein